MAMNSPNRTPRTAPMVSETIASRMPSCPLVLADDGYWRLTQTSIQTMTISSRVPAIGRRTPVVVAKAIT